MIFQTGARDHNHPQNCLATQAEDGKFSIQYVATQNKERSIKGEIEGTYEY
jgi:hypothetical protein